MGSQMPAYRSCAKRLVRNSLLALNHIPFASRANSDARKSARVATDTAKTSIGGESGASSTQYPVIKAGLWLAFTVSREVTATEKKTTPQQVLSEPLTRKNCSRQLASGTPASPDNGQQQAWLPPICCLV